MDWQARLRLKIFELSDEEREAAYHEIRDSYQMRPAYLVMLVLACLVAIFGLLINSPAVVIGAMLISPLMSPFLSAGLALAIGDWKLGRSALRTIILSVVAAVFISALAVAISPLKPATPEILARTNPNLIDLFIAFFSGFAGTYTLVARRGGTTIPGVAIATAVMPPLCVVGYGVFFLDPTITFGALSLFVTNLAAIIISAAIVFLLASFRPANLSSVIESQRTAPVRITASLLVLAVLAIPLGVALFRAAAETQLRERVRRSLAEELERDPDRAKLGTDWTAKEADDGSVEVAATVYTIEYFKMDEVEALERSLERGTGKRVALELEQVRVQQGGLADAGPAAATSAIGPPAAPAVERRTLGSQVRELRPAVTAAVEALGGRLDRFLVTADDAGLRGLEVYALRDAPPENGEVVAARRVLRAELVRERLGGEDCAVTFHVRPATPIVLAVDMAAREPFSGAGDALAQIQTILAGDSSLRVRARMRDGVEVSPEKLAMLGDELALRLGVDPSRIALNGGREEEPDAPSLDVVFEPNADADRELK